MRCAMPGDSDKPSLTNAGDYKRAVKARGDAMAVTQEELRFASAEVAAELRRWLAHLGPERRMSPETVEAYERDVRQFLGFLTEHIGEQPTLTSLAAIEPRDIRAFIAAPAGARAGSPPPVAPPARRS